SMGILVLQTVPAKPPIWETSANSCHDRALAGCRFDQYYIPFIFERAACGHSPSRCLLHIEDEGIVGIPVERRQKFLRRDRKFLSSAFCIFYNAVSPLIADGDPSSIIRDKTSWPGVNGQGPSLELLATTLDDLHSFTSQGVDVFQRTGL